MSKVLSAASFAHLRKEGDFQDILKYQTHERVEMLKLQLQEAVVAAGTARTELSDFLKARLGQVRRYLAHVA